MNPVFSHFVKDSLTTYKLFYLLSANDVISRHAVVVTQWPERHVAQVSSNIYKLCFKFLRELSEF